MIATGILLNLIIGVSTLAGLWFVYLWKKNPGVVDLGWAIGLTLMGLTHNLGGESPSLEKILVSMLVLAWGIRLGGYLFWTRLRLGKKDARYETLLTRQKISARFFFLIHYMIQACFQTVVGFVFIFTAQITTYKSAYSIFGLILWCIGFAGSVLTDAQLNTFRAVQDNRGKVCQTGIWKYSRHPNYFFEILLWHGFAFIGLPVSLGWLGLLSPIVLMLTMALITGPLSEKQSIKTKPEAYNQYQQSTSMIIPWFKKKKAN